MNPRMARKKTSLCAVCSRGSMETALSIMKLRRFVVAAGVLFLFAAPAGAITVFLPESAIVPPSGSNTVDIDVDNAEGHFGAMLTVQFDPGKVTPGAVTAVGIATGCQLVVNTQNPTNQVRISMACSEPLVGTGPLVRLTFNGNAGASGTTPLTFVACQFDEDNPNTCLRNDGELLVTSCLTNIDGKGSTAQASTDGVYIYNALLGVNLIVPPLFRQLDPTIPANDVLAARVESILGPLNVDGKGATQGSTDGVYIYNTLLGLGIVVPPLFRQLDPTIPPDATIISNVHALCP